MRDGGYKKEHGVKDRTVVIDYTNWRGERRERTVAPINICFTHTEHYSKPQWLMLAMDEERKERRFFALMNVHSWRVE